MILTIKEIEVNDQMVELDLYENEIDILSHAMDVFENQKDIYNDMQAYVPLMIKYLIEEKVIPVRTK